MFSQAKAKQNPTLETLCLFFVIFGKLFIEGINRVLLHREHDTYLMDAWDAEQITLQTLYSLTYFVSI